MPKYQLALTNLEVKLMFQGMVHDWFAPVQPDYNDFVRAMLLGDVDAMNEYMNRLLYRHLVISTPERGHLGQSLSVLPWFYIRSAC